MTLQKIAVTLKDRKLIVLNYIFNSADLNVSLAELMVF